MAGSVNCCVEISLGIVQKKTLSFSSSPEQSASEPLSFSTKIVMLAAISMPDPYRFPAFQQNACFVTRGTPTPEVSLPSESMIMAGT